MLDRDLVNRIEAVEAKKRGALSHLIERYKLRKISREDYEAERQRVLVRAVDARALILKDAAPVQ